jgi:7-keto-8-aminopelargonate synthetase-like enzyme
VTLDAAVLQAWMSDDASEPGVAPNTDMQLHSLRMFATNDYLGLSTHVRVRQAAAEAALKYGSGSTVLGICSGHCAATP